MALLGSCGGVKSFKDPVHGYNDICSRVAQVVDSWPVQRLRWIKQTAQAFLVYHGMEHSRFNHSLGAAHLAGEVLSAVVGNTRLYYRGSGNDIAAALESAVEVFQLAALVHDLGHLPYSHSSEVGILDARVIYRAEGFEHLPTRHEEYTYSLLGIVAQEAEEAGVAPIFTGRLRDDLQYILRGGPAPYEGPASAWCASNILHKLIASGLDVDRMDYLLRDSIYAGVRYGVYDVDRLIRVLLATPLIISDGVVDERRACNIAVLDKGVSILETFLLARFYMFSEVYLHRVVEAYNSIHARLLGVLARDGVVTVGGGGGEVEIPLPMELEKGKPEALEAWKQLDDLTMSNLYRRVAQGRVERASREARELAERLMERRHMRIYWKLEDPELWRLYRNYLQDGPGTVPPEARGPLDEIVEMQREQPLLIVRPLRVDMVSMDEIGIYNRSQGRVTPLGDARAPEIRRLRKLAELSLYRVVVFAPRGLEKEAEKAVRLLNQARESLAAAHRR
jgi:HD superfamily phosphohydrolase